MVGRCSMVTLWASNTLLVLPAPGCIALAATFILKAAAPTTNGHALVRTPSLASRSSKSCEAWTFWLLKFQSKIQFNLQLAPLWLKAVGEISVIVLELYTPCLGEKGCSTSLSNLFSTQAQCVKFELCGYRRLFSNFHTHGCQLQVKLHFTGSWKQ